MDDGIEARDALVKLRALDPDDAVGGSLLEAVRVRALVGDDTSDRQSEPGPTYFTGAAAWDRATRGIAPA
jgi:hypothetical protein